MVTVSTRTVSPAPAEQVILSTPTASTMIRLAIDQVPAFDDDADTASLRSAALQSKAYYQRLPATQNFRFGSENFSAQDLIDTMDTLVALIDGATTKTDWLNSLAQHFWIYQSVGVDARRTVTFSSYYEPTISARLLPDAIYKYPLYTRPSDLIDVDLSLFNSALAGTRIVGHVVGRSLQPYYTREDIDSERVLKGERLEIAYARNPLDIFFLQVEGSGWLDVGSGLPVRIRYDGDNGLPFRSVGQYLVKSGRVPAQGFGHQKFQSYMDQHPLQRQKLLNVDERYVFFELDTGSSSVSAYGNLNVPLTSGRSVATDPKIFPKGALAWISVRGEDPSKSTTSTTQGFSGRHSFSRFVLNQDEGGAIKGPGRVDIFAGHGPDAEYFATHLWNPGTLYFLVKKREPDSK